MGNNYSDKGLDIRYVSGDLESRREDVLRARKDQGIADTLIFDGKGWRTDLAKKYHVRTVPCFVLVDKDDRVIAQGNWRGAEREAWV